MMSTKKNNARSWLGKMLGLWGLGLSQCAFASPLPQALPQMNCTDPHAAPAGQPNAYYDGFFIGAQGCLYDPANTDIKNVPPMVGPKGDNGQRIWDVNGASTTPQNAAYQFLAIATSTDIPVVGIYDAASGKPGQLAQGYLNNHTPSVRSITAQVLAVLDRQETDTVLLRGGSEGTLLIDQALRVALQTLRKQGKNASQAMASLRVETHGSVVRNFPDGPRYVHYANLLDPISSTAGVLATGSHPGKSAVIVVFAAKTLPLEGEYEQLTKPFQILLSLHGEGNYLDHRVPFETAYAHSNPKGQPQIVTYQQLTH